MITITSNDSLVNGYQPTPAAQSQGNASANATGSASGSDTVQLSLNAQATAMQQQGMTVSEIASFLDLTTAEVNGYLGIVALNSSAGATPSADALSTAPAPMHFTAAASGTPSQSTKT